MNTLGKKEIKEAVLVATLCATATGLVGLGIEFLRRKIFTDKRDKK
jgi:hypothetical protein